MNTIIREKCIVSYKKDQLTKEKVFAAVLDYYQQLDLYSSQEIGQSDIAKIDAIQLMQDLAEDVLGFEINCD